jgi:hypothetical protein
MPRQRPSRTNPEALRALRERLQASQEAAQKLAEEALRPTSDRPPPAGWDVPRHASRANDELDALMGLIGALRDVLPPELLAQLADLTRQLLVVVRAVLDWWIDRLERAADARGAEDDVEDIPIS